MRGEFERAIQLFEQASSYGGVAFDRATIECRSLADDAARGRVDRQAAIHLSQAVDHYDRGEVSEWHAELLKALEASPGYARTHRDLGSYYGFAGQEDMAIPKFEEALACDPEFASAHFCLGVAAEKRGMEEEAVRHYLAAISIDDGFAEAHNNLGFHYARTGQLGRAEEHWYKAVELRYIVNVAAIKRAAGVRSSGCMTILATGLLAVFVMVLIALQT